MQDYKIDYEKVLFIKKAENNDAIYIRYKGANKTEFCIPYNSITNWDKNIEFHNHCVNLEKANKKSLFHEKLRYYKYININNTKYEKVCFTKYDICYFNSEIAIFKLNIDNRYVIWNRFKGTFKNASCVVKSNKIPQHIPAILASKKIPTSPTKSILTNLIILSNNKEYKEELNKYYKILNS